MTPQWEYRSERWEPDPMLVPAGTVWCSFIDWLDVFGSDGWELVRATSCIDKSHIGSGGYRGESCLFKRQVRE